MKQVIPEMILIWRAEIYNQGYYRSFSDNWDLCNLLVLRFQIFFLARSTHILDKPIIFDDFIGLGSFRSSELKN